MTMTTELKKLMNSHQWDSMSDLDRTVAIIHNKLTDDTLDDSVRKIWIDASKGQGWTFMITIFFNDHRPYDIHFHKMKNLRFYREEKDPNKKAKELELIAKIANEIKNTTLKEYYS